MAGTMAELSKCRLCGGEAERLQAGRVQHEKHGPWCPLRKADSMTDGDWQTLMGRGEPVGYVNDYQLDCIELKKTIVLSAVQNDHFNTEVYTQAPAVDDGVLRDAARYRWLCEEIENGAVYGVSGALVELYDDTIYDNGDELSAAIDNAIKKEQQDAKSHD